jgi:hypothetical protein
MGRDCLMEPRTLPRLTAGTGEASAGGGDTRRRQSPQFGFCMGSWERCQRRGRPWVGARERLGPIPERARITSRGWRAFPRYGLPNCAAGSPARRGGAPLERLCKPVQPAWVGVVHNAHRIEMHGDSMRKKRGTEPSRISVRLRWNPQRSRWFLRNSS